MEWTMLILIILSFMLMHVNGVEALTNNSDIIGIVVAGCVGFALLTVVIGLLIAYCNWSTWFNNWMKLQGKIRMPKTYFNKKQEVKKRIISVSSKIPIHQVNGHLPSPVVDRGKLVQGWHQGSPGFTNRIYEEKNAIMELGEEADDEFKIETEVVDNEILDVGPYKHDHSKEVPIKGDVYAEPYIYSTVDNARKAVNGIANSVKPVSATRTPTTIGNNRKAEYYTAGGDTENTFDEDLLYL